MINNNNRRRNFRPRPQKNNFRRRNGSSSSNNGSSYSGNGNLNFNRNGSMTNPHNVEKTVQKFQQLAKDAQSSGDPVLVENYLQHADHYGRRLSELNAKSKIVVNNENNNTDNNEDSKSETIGEPKPENLKQSSS